jgi:hypothetical protein
MKLGEKNIFCTFWMENLTRRHCLIDLDKYEDNIKVDDVISTGLSWLRVGR